MLIYLGIVYNDNRVNIYLNFPLIFKFSQFKQKLSL